MKNSSLLISLISYCLFVAAYAMPQNSQASNINWNEQPQERPNLAMAASAPGSCRMENAVQRCSLAPPQGSRFVEPKRMS